MAGSLVVRLTQTDPDESRNIRTESFIFGLEMIANGRHTQVQIEGFFNMTASDITGFGILVGKMESGAASLEIQRTRIAHVRSILAIWEMDGKPATYDTPDKIEVELLAIDSYPV